MSLTELIDLLNKNAGFLSTVFSGIVMLATLVYAYLTASLVKETRRMRELQTEPIMEVIASPHEEHLNFFILRVKNIGLGSAHDVTFSFSGESLTDGEKELVKDFSKSQFLVKGLKYFGPGQQLQSHFTQMTNNFESKIKAQLLIDVKYRNSTGKLYENRFSICFEEFEGFGTLGVPPLHSMATSLKKIEHNLDHITLGWKKIKVDTYTENDRQNENERMGETIV